jgi:hypothetical protein
MSSLNAVTHAPEGKTFDQQFAEVFNESKAATPSVVGVVTYDVRVKCPHCLKTLALNKHPYNDDDTEFCPAEDDLGEALFGWKDQPATWEGIAIKYKCFGCLGDFTVGSLEM